MDCFIKPYRQNNKIGIVKSGSTIEILFHATLWSEKGQKIWVPKDAIRIIKGEYNLSTYQFNTMKAEHFFCKTCGVYTHHNRRTDPNGVGINIGCIDAIDPFEYEAGFVDMKNK